MLPGRRQSTRPLFWSQGPASAPAPVAPRRSARPSVGGGVTRGLHPLTQGDENAYLFAYERRVKDSFDTIVPVLKRLSGLQHEENFEMRAQAIAREQLGFELPPEILGDAWVTQLDMRRLFAWCVFETYRRFCDEFFTDDPLGSGDEDAFQAFLQDCGFHTLDVSPCADGRLAHVIRYVLRLPYRAVRRKSYAGALFDIEDSLQKWVETEMLRFREGRPNTADAPTRYLKAVVYHYSSSDPEHEGCAAHGSDEQKAAQAGLERLLGFQQAVQNSFCCGASIDLLLIGMDTDTDAIRVHVPGADGRVDPQTGVEAQALYADTVRLPAVEAEARILERVKASAPGVADGMARLAARLIANNLSQIDYVRSYHDGRYADVGHAERFIGVGIGFEEIQLRNLTYFAYMDTVEEAAPDLDVGVKIGSRLNVAHGLPVPVVVRYDYHGQVPGSRERAVAHCERVDRALHSRYQDLSARGLLHTLQIVRDCNARGPIEALACSVRGTPQGGH
ncbi:carboxysome shell carbonic anhydrase [Thioalkalivibrio nitratireducens]|uniref:carboxysome shell carbonic anhydrase n=1 Tax=Thioalkalivibrio nitratireducens TaxID=186931 RepID=UPI0009F8C513